MRCLRTAACMLLLAGCGGVDRGGGVLSDSDVAARVATGHLQRHMTQAPRSLDPSFMEDVGAYAIADDLFEGLTRLDAAGNVVPGVADRWEVSADGRQWRFFLRSDAVWSDGEPVTAGDFVYAWRRVVDPATASPLAQQLQSFAGAAQIMRGAASPESLGVVAIDAHTLQVQLVAPTPYLPYLLTSAWMVPLRESVIRAQGTAWTEPGHLIGNGPFVLVSRVINGPVTLERNARYRDAAGVRLQAVTYHPLPETAAATSRFLAGDLDLTDRFQIDDLAWLSQVPGVDARLEPYFGTFMLGMQVSRAPFDDARLRQALVMAIDREIIAGKLLKGRFQAAYALVPPLPDRPAMRPEWAAWTDTERHRRARELYAAAGYSAARPLQVELWYPTVDADTRRVLTAMAAMWRVNLGADVQLRNEEWRVHQQNRRLRRHRLFFYPWIGDYPDPLTFLALPLPQGGQNYMDYNGAGFNAALAAADVATDGAARRAALDHAEQLLLDEAVIVPVYYYRSRHLLRSYVQGWRENPMDRHASRDLWLAAPTEH